MLILGSYGFTDPYVRPQLGALISDKSKNMMIVPLACRDGKTVAENEKRYAAEIGFDPDRIFIFDENDPCALLSMDFGYIVVPGGNTFKLLYLVKNYHLDEFIKEQVKKGAHYLGFSAGAYIVCDKVDYVRLYDDNEHITNDDFSALGLTEKVFLCHYNERGIRDIVTCLSYFEPGRELVTINDDEVKTIEV